MNVLLTILITSLVYICLFLYKTQFFRLLHAIFKSIKDPVDYLVDELDKANSAVKNITFSKIILNCLIIFSAVVMVISEFGSLQGILAHVYGTTPIPGIGVPLASINAIVYISISTIVGLIALECLSFKKVITEIVLDSEKKNDVLNWSAFKSEFTKPSNIGKKILGIFFLIILLLFAYYQGKLGVLRDSKLIDSNQHHHETEVVAFLLGFFTPIIASISILTIDIFISMITYLLALGLKINLILLSSAENITQKSINLVTEPANSINNNILPTKKNSITKDEFLSQSRDLLKVENPIGIKSDNLIQNTIETLWNNFNIKKDVKDKT